MSCGAVGYEEYAKFEALVAAMWQKAPGISDARWRSWPRSTRCRRTKPCRRSHITSCEDCARQPFGTLSGGQQARLQILLPELAGSTLLLLDEPTDNLDLASAEALQQGLESYQGTVVAVTHDRWFARSLDRFLVFGGDASVYEADEPVWKEARVSRSR